MFDIGSGSVGGAIALIGATEPPMLLYSTRSDILFTSETNGVRLLSLMARALSEVMLALAHEGFARAGLSAKRPKVAEAIVSLSAPWTVSRTFTLHLRNTKPARITEPVFQALLNEEKKNTSTRTLPKGSVEMERKLIKSVLNGYETSLPYGRDAVDAEFTLCSSYSLPKITEKVSDTIAQLIHTPSITFHSFSLLSFATLRDLYPQNENFIFLDVSGEQSEVSVVKKSVLLETISFPLGKNHLIRALAEEAGIPPASAETFLSLQHEQRGAGSLYEYVKKVSSVFEAQWLAYFFKTMEAFSAELFLPKVLFLTADTALAPRIKSAITKGDFSRFTLASLPFDVQCVNSESLNPYLHQNPSGSADPFLMLLTLFSARLRSSVHRQDVSKL